MKKFGPLVLAIGLAGCATVNHEELMARAQSSCAASTSAGTPEYDACVQNLYKQLSGENAASRSILSTPESNIYMQP